MKHEKCPICKSGLKYIKSGICPICGWKQGERFGWAYPVAAVLTVICFWALIWRWIYGN